LVDINADGYTDIYSIKATTSHAFLFFLNDGFGNFHPNFPPDSASIFSKAEFYDLNKDGLKDIVSFIPNKESTIGFYENDGQANFELVDSINTTIFNTVFNQNIHFEVLDLNNNAAPELIAYGFDYLTNAYKPLAIEKDNFTILNNQFEALQYYNSYLFDDFDNDGDIDFIGANFMAYYTIPFQGLSKLHLLRNDLKQNYFHLINTNNTTQSYPFCHGHSLDKVYDEIAVSIVNLKGQMLDNYKIENSNSIPFPAHLQKGVYIVNAKTNTKEVFNFKILRWVISENINILILSLKCNFHIQALS